MHRITQTLQTRSALNLWLALLLALWMGVFSSAVVAQDFPAPNPADDQLAVVNINTDDAMTLAAILTGIGETRALAIVADREANGPFVTVDDLTRVSGIGPATVAANRDRMVVDVQ